MRITGYSDRISVTAGETIRFMASCEEHREYRADLVRIINGDCNPAGPGYREAEIECPANGTYPGRHQPIFPGSYVRTDRSARLALGQGFTVAAMIWPTTPLKGEQTIVSCWSSQDGAGFELLIDDGGALSLRIGDGSGNTTVVSAESELLAEHWHLVAARVEADGRRIVLRQQRQVAYPHHPATVEVAREGGALAVVEAPVLIAARRAPDTPDGARMATEAHYNGKIDSPRLFAGAIPFENVALGMQPTLPAHLRPSLLAAWDFAQEIPTQRVIDISGNGMHGQTVNLPARAMTGHNWSGRYRNWRDAPHEYGAIHFHDDDIYDAGWDADFALTVPEDLRSGCYAMRLRAGEDEEYIPFFVRRPTGRPSAKILYLAQTATYMAYANLFVFAAPLAELLANRLIIVQPWEQHLNLHPELGNSLYDAHSDGSGICYSSRLRPILNMRPKVMTATAGVGSMLWAYNADTHLTDWLEAKGYDFDVATDEDLHADGAELLRHYQVVMTGTHPEYYSTAMLDALQAYTAGGGRLMYMGGNGFYWRIAYHPTLPGVIEVRRAEDGTRAWKARPGEFHHSFNGEYGGMWRSQGRAPQQLAGTGFIAQGFDLSSPYRRTPESNDPRVAFALEGIDQDETIGGFGLIGGGAAGLEVDIVDPALGTPPHTIVVARSDELPDTFLLVNEEQLIATPDTMGSSNPRIRSDLAFHETGNGGGVFAFSSMAWCGSLSHAGYDNNVSRITANVLNRFLSDEPL